MDEEAFDDYDRELELALFREYRDVVSQFQYVVETERRFYLCNAVDLQVRNPEGDMYFELRMSDAWVWDMYRPARFVKNVRVVTFKDVNVEELDKPDLRLPGTLMLAGGTSMRPGVWPMRTKRDRRRLSASKELTGKLS